MIPLMIVSAILGGYLGWITGHGSRVIPKAVYRLLKALPYGLVVLPVAPWFAVPVFFITALAVSSGHGNGQDLGQYKEPSGAEKLEIFTDWAKHYLSGYQYDFIFLGITGLAVTLPAGIVLLNPVIALSGLWKPVAYALGRLFSHWGFKMNQTVQGEIMTWAGLSLAVVLGRMM